MMLYSQQSSKLDYERRFKELQVAYHSQCLFRKNPPVDNLRFSFSEDGVLTGSFHCSTEHQSYDGIVHGGIIAAIIDASMAQCCMGHGIVAYTCDLSIRYRNPVKIATVTGLETRLVDKALGVLFSLECLITQKNQVHVEAAGRFFKTPLKDTSVSTSY
jgi:acyl-coenzyme A thioesterase PaaI-like protein